MKDIPLFPEVFKNAPDFESFWKAFPKQRKVNKPGAAKAWVKACRLGTADMIMRSLEAYINSEDVKSGFACMPTTWLNQQRWDIEVPVEVFDPGNARGIILYRLMKLAYVKPNNGGMNEGHIAWMRQYEAENVK